MASPVDIDRLPAGPAPPSARHGGRPVDPGPSACRRPPRARHREAARDLPLRRRRGGPRASGPPPAPARPARGFSLLVVLVVLVVAALLATTAATLATTDRGTSEARARRAQALAAAEAGLLVYLTGAAPGADCALPAGSTLLAVDLPGLDTDPDPGAEFLPRARIRVGSVAAGVDSCHVGVEGEILDAGGRVVGRAALDGIVALDRLRHGYGGQKDYNPRGTGSDSTGRLGVRPNL